MRSAAIPKPSPWPINSHMERVGPLRGPAGRKVETPAGAAGKVYCTVAVRGVLHFAKATRLPRYSHGARPHTRTKPPTHVHTRTREAPSSLSAARSEFCKRNCTPLAVAPATLTAHP